MLVEWMENKSSKQLLPTTWELVCPAAPRFAIGTCWHTCIYCEYYKFSRQWWWWWWWWWWWRWWWWWGRLIIQCPGSNLMYVSIWYIPVKAALFTSIWQYYWNCLFLPPCACMPSAKDLNLVCAAKVLHLQGIGVLTALVHWSEVKNTLLNTCIYCNIIAAYLWTAVNHTLLLLGWSYLS